MLLFAIELNDKLKDFVIDEEPEGLLRRLIFAEVEFPLKFFESHPVRRIVIVDFSGHSCLIFGILPLIDRNEIGYDLLTSFSIQPRELLFDRINAHDRSLFAPSEIASLYAETSVPIFSPRMTERRLPGLNMSNTTIGTWLSIQSENAVESITFKRFTSASA